MVGEDELDALHEDILATEAAHTRTFIQNEPEDDVMHVPDTLPAVDHDGRVVGVDGRSLGRALACAAQKSMILCETHEHCKAWVATGGDMEPILRWLANAQEYPDAAAHMAVLSAGGVGSLAQTCYGPK
eukprot:2331352-Amphidinium_carterae.1